MTNPPSPPADAFRLARIDPAVLAKPRAAALDAATVAAARTIVDDIRLHGHAALRTHAERLGDLAPGAPLSVGPAECRRALDSLEPADRAALERADNRIRAFARAQRACLRDLETPIPGGLCGHRVVPLASAGCYAPGGRFPLPSSVLMTAAVAHEAGVARVWVASPRPAPATLAAAAIAGADGVLRVGGAQAIAAVAFGISSIDLPPCDAVVGPGNRWVTAAKWLVSADCAIDMLAGPSEVMIIADDSADPVLVAADMIAQAEHDDDAASLLITTSDPLVGAVEHELSRLLTDLPTARTARCSLMRAGRALVVGSLDEAARLADAYAPEHLELMTRCDDTLRDRLSRYGALFIGPASAEVAGDYGAGPNHVLPTGGSARWSSGLSVLTFLRMRTYVHLDGTSAGAGALYADTARLARLEGLAGHALAAEHRRARPGPQPGA